MKYDDLVVGELVVPEGSSKWLADAAASSGSLAIEAALRDARELVYLIEKRRDGLRQKSNWSRIIPGLREFALSGYGNCLKSDGSASLKDVTDNLRNFAVLGLMAYSYQMMVDRFLTKLHPLVLSSLMSVCFVIFLILLAIAVLQGYWMWGPLVKKFFRCESATVSPSGFKPRFCIALSNVFTGLLMTWIVVTLLGLVFFK